MEAEGWWVETKMTNEAIRRRIMREMVAAHWRGMTRPAARQLADGVAMRAEACSRLGHPRMVVA